MQRILSNETEQEMAELYAGGLSVTKIAVIVGVSRNIVYNHTRLMQRINPDTGKPFESSSQYQKYLVMQKINPDTGEPFESLGQYDDYHARRRQNQKINQELSDLITRELDRLGETQGWLALQLGITEGAVSRYVSGKNTPRASLQGRLIEIFELPYKTLGDLLREKEH